MASNERIKKYLEAGTVLGQVTRARAEEIVRELASAGDIQREQAQEWVDNLVERSRKTSEQILDLIRHEVSAQLSKIDATSLETLAGQVADLLKRSAAAGRTATADAAAQAAKGAQAAREAGGEAPGLTTATEEARNEDGRQEGPGDQEEAPPPPLPLPLPRPSSAAADARRAKKPPAAKKAAPTKKRRCRNRTAPKTAPRQGRAPTTETPGSSS